MRYELNDLGLPEATVYPSGFQVDRDFDALNRPQQVSHNGALIGLFQYRGPGAVERPPTATAWSAKPPSTR